MLNDEWMDMDRGGLVRAANAVGDLLVSWLSEPIACIRAPDFSFYLVAQKCRSGGGSRGDAHQALAAEADDG